MRGTRARWAVALRIARRSALTSRGRSLLIVALIAAPIVGLSAAAVLLPSTQATLAETIQGELGHAQAKLTVVGTPQDHVSQGVDGGYDYSASSNSSSDAKYVDPRTALPGTRVLAIGSAAATFHTPKGETSIAVTTGPSWDPSLDGGPYVLLSGHRPTSADEVLVSPAVLTRLGAHVGGTITMVQPKARTLTVVGTSLDRNQGSSAQIVFASAEILPSSSPEGTTYYVPSAPVDWATVQKLNAVGTTVFSREVVLDPPSDAVTYGGGVNFSVVVVVAMALTFALLEVALLAGSAFLVGARLQQRTLAVIASVGADRAVLRRVVTASGVVLGAVGGVAGVGLGIAGAAIVMRLTDNGTWSRYPGFHLWWPLLLGIAVFGVLVGWIAALVPARAASKFDVVRALRGARTPQKVGKRPVAGVVVLAAGVVCTLAGGGVLYGALQHPSYGDPAEIGALVLLGGGSVLAQLGVLLCSGLVLRGIARLLVRAPLAARLAARDTSRNLGRAVPASASVMTTVFVAAFVMCIGNSASIQSAASHFWQAAKIGQGVSPITSGGAGGPTSADAARWIGVLHRDLPSGSFELLSTSSGGPSETTSNRLRDAVVQVRLSVFDGTCGSELTNVHDLRCGPFSSRNGGTQQVTVGSVAALAALLGHAPSAAAQAALANGGAVALRGDLTPGGVATLDWFTPKQFAGDTSTETPRRVTHLRAVVDLPDHPVQTTLFVSAATAARIHVTVAPDTVLVDFSRPPTDAELDAASTAVSALANQPGITAVTIEQGPQDYGTLIAWYVLLACLVIAISAGATAVGLARVDGRGDDLTLASLGASPRIRKSVAFVQALIVCGLGAVVGTALGLLPALALGVATTSFPFAPPTPQLVLTAIGIPIVIACGSWLFVRTRRGDLTHRAAIA